MGNKLYVGNLNYSAGEEDIKAVFTKYGEVKDVQVTFRPFWIKRAPALIDHIVIQIAQPSSEQL